MKIPEWIAIRYDAEDKEYYVFDEGCGCCSEVKSNPNRADLEILVNNLEEQIKLTKKAIKERKS